MTTERYPAGDRPMARFVKADHPVRDGWKVTQRNGRTTYMRHPHIVGEVAVANEKVEILPYTERSVRNGRLLTPYDTGARAEPKPWPLLHPMEPDRYGKVDFDDDAGETVCTVWVARGPSGKYTVHIYPFDEGVSTSLYPM